MNLLKQKKYLGIEFGSTRIKAVLIDGENMQLAQGGHDWENDFVDGFWTYSLESIKNGMQIAYAKLAGDYQEKFGEALTQVDAIGFSGMMHGYMAFDKHGKLLVPFRTWRNTTTESAAEQLTQLLQFNIPQRFSIAHLYQAILNGEAHIARIAELTTLAGYVHHLLCGEKNMGIGEASGMFPIDSDSNDFDREMLAMVQNEIDKKGVKINLAEVLPTVLCAGEKAGVLTKEGAALLDISGKLQAGIPLCPPEGDAGTGMVATNSVAQRTGNISAGTSVFAMVVLEKPLKNLHIEIDMVTTPVGKRVAMAHCNTCTSDIDAWVKLFGEAATLMGASFTKPQLYDMLYAKALQGAEDCGGLLAYNYFAGEPITKIDDGRPLFVRLPNASFSLANTMQALLFSAMATLKIGMDILFDEGVTLDKIHGHGGFFKTEEVGQRVTAAALNTPVTVMKTAGEGGAFGMAVLAAFMQNGNGASLEQYLENTVFAGAKGVTVAPQPNEVAAFEKYIQRYKKGLILQGVAAKNVRD